MKKRTGTGGCGDRKLSPDQIQRLGSHGFKTRLGGYRKSEAFIFAMSPHLKGKIVPTINIGNTRVLSDYQVRREPNNDHDGYGVNNFMDTDTLDSTDVGAPPN